MAKIMVMKYQHENMKINNESVMKACHVIMKWQ